MKTVYKVNGMKCIGCQLLVEGALNELEAVTKASVNLENASVEVESEVEVDHGLLQEAVKKAGFELV